MAYQKSRAKLATNQLASEIGDAIRNFREKLEANQRDFARLIGVTQSAVGQWETNKTKPSPMALMAIGNLGGADKKFWYLQAGQEISDIEDAVDSYKKTHPDWNQDTAGTRNVPLLRDAAAAGTSRAVDEREIERIIALPTDWLPAGGKLFAIKVHGDSMSPVLETGYIVVVDVSKRDPKELTGRMVLAQEDEGVTIKWLRKDGSVYMLVPQHTSRRHPVRVFQKGADLALVGAVVIWTGWPYKEG